MESKKYIDHKTGKSFPPAMAFSGFFIMAVGLVFTVLGNWAALIIVLIGAILAFTFDGITIDSKNHRIKKYTLIIFHKEGKWISLNHYPEMAVLKRNISSRGYNSTTISQSVENLYYDICLLGPNHHQKLIIQRFKKVDGVEEKAKEYAELLGIPIVDYSPRVSESSRNKRYRR